jgi:hypothetical protein
MRSRRILCLLPLLLTSLVISTALPAPAAVVAVEDRPNSPAAPPRVDLTKGRYFNGAKQIRFHAHLVDLRRTTGVAIGFDMNDAKFGNTFYRVWLTKRHARLMRMSLQPTEFPRCPGMRTTWQPRLDLVTATVPHSCVRGTAFTGALAMSTAAYITTGTGGGDGLPGRTVQRG